MSTTITSTSTTTITTEPRQESAKEKTSGPLDSAACYAISDTERLDWLQANQKTAWRVTHDEWEQGLADANAMIERLRSELTNALDEIVRLHANRS